MAPVVLPALHPRTDLVLMSTAETPDTPTRFTGSRPVRPAGGWDVGRRVVVFPSCLATTNQAGAFRAAQLAGDTASLGAVSEGGAGGSVQAEYERGKARRAQWVRGGSSSDWRCPPRGHVPQHLPPATTQAICRQSAEVGSKVRNDPSTREPTRGTRAGQRQRGRSDVRVERSHNPWVQDFVPQEASASLVRCGSRGAPSLRSSERGSRRPLGRRPLPAAIVPTAEDGPAVLGLPWWAPRPGYVPPG
jgi:hypothetical protein